MVRGRPTNLNKSRARWVGVFLFVFFEHFGLVYDFSFLSPSLWETADIY